MTRNCRKMALCNAYRSFAIYLVIVFIIPESPVSAFTIRRMRTTTLRPLTDLTGEESALLEVKSELSKLHNERDHVKYGRNRPTARKSVNFLSPDKKLATSRKFVLAPTSVKSIKKEDEPMMPPNEPTRIDPETTTSNTEFQTRITSDSTLISVQEHKEEIKRLGAQLSHIQTDVNTLVEDNSREQRQQDLAKNTTNKIDTVTNLEDVSTSTENMESTRFEINDVQTTGETTTPEIPTDTSSDAVSTTIVDENDRETTKDVDFTHEKKNTSEMTETEFTSTSESETVRSTEIETPVTYSTGLTEAISRQLTKAYTKNPSWKKYTVIERKRIINTSEIDLTSTERTDELERAESVSSKVTLENAVSVTPIDSLEELRQELISNSKTTTVKNVGEDTTVFLTTQTTANVLEAENKRISSTESIVKETTTEAKPDFVSSKRAGYLDFSAKQTMANEAVTTTEQDKSELNEKELIGSMFEIETQEDGPELKNATLTESQSQLVDDAIKEELLKEEVLSDHVENSKRFEDQQDLDKVKSLDTTDTDDSLSVRPIAQGKGVLYTVSSNYKRMKKIEVQPSKPFVRDPDDNSWRNESLTSLGIVFKAKNASKPFTQVLKNKTEAELNNVIQSERDNTNEVPDLRQRLEKIAEVRKSRKKKIDKFGDTVYSDYEETSGETSSTPKTDTVLIPIMEVAGEIFFGPSTSPSPSKEVTPHTTTPGVYMYKEETVTTKKPKKTHKFSEYYDTTDEYDIDYINLSKIDLKKFTTRLFAQDDKTTATTSPMLNPFTKPMISLLPERKPTVQYFPPRGPPSREQHLRGPPMREQPFQEQPLRKQPILQKVNINDYDGDFQRKVNMYTQDKTPKDASPATYATFPLATVIKDQTTQHYMQNSVIPADPARQYKPANLKKNLYVTFPSRVADHGNRYPGSNDESFNRASYVIKHYKDLINEAVKDDYDKSGEYMPGFTEAPLTGVTMTKEKDPLKHLDNDYDYDANFRRDILSRFVDNFNQNSERFKVDFPILYNNSVVHMKTQDNGKVVASSSAFMKRLYGDAPGAGGALKPCDPHCEMKVELSPAYELHYYVPDQEEKEEAELKPVTLPFSYRL